MVTNYFTLFHLSADLNRDFAGQIISKIFTQFRGELVLTFKENPAAILIGCDAADNYIYVRKEFNRARRNSVDIFPDVHGLKLNEVSMDKNDRQIMFHLEDRRELIVQLFGVKANTVLTDLNNVVIEQFLKKPDLSNTRLDSNSHADLSDIPVSLSKDAKVKFRDMNIGSVFTRILPQFGKIIVKELLFRNNFDFNEPFAGLQESEIIKLMDDARQLKSELLSKPSPRIYFKDNLPVRFSIIPLTHLNEYEFQVFGTASEAISEFRSKVRHEQSVVHEKDEIITVLKNEINQCERTIEKLNAEVENSHRADEYEKYGKLLISNLHLIKKGDVEALVENFIDNSNELIRIPLDPYLAPAKNAERYFEKAVKSRKALEQQRKRIIELGERKNLSSLLLMRMEEITTGEDLHLFMKENNNALLKFGIKTKKSGQIKKPESLPFRIFSVEGGFQVWAGKSSENNDLLSTRHTAKNDLWFHARGVGGSHVVLKIGTGKGEVSKKTIDQAAAIAAYYSKMKSSKLVPVAMCEGKYVRKQKGAPPGTVTLEREKTIFVEPSLPKQKE